MSPVYCSANLKKKCHLHTVQYTGGINLERSSIWDTFSLSNATLFQKLHFHTLPPPRWRLCFKVLVIVFCDNSQEYCIYGQIFPDHSTLLVQRWTTSSKSVGPPKAAMDGSPSFCLLGQRRPTGGYTASLHKLAAGRKLAATHLNVSNRRMCVCTGFKSGSYNKSYYNRPFKNDTGL